VNILAAETLVRRLFAKHNLKKWNFKFDRAHRRFGCCNFSTRTISLSKILVELNSPQKVNDTLLHEIAHAIVGPRHAHDKIWCTKISEIGGKPTARFHESEIEIPKSKFVAVCPNCQKKIPTFRRKKNVACRSCCQKFNRGKFSSEFRLQFRKN